MPKKRKAGEYMHYLGELDFLCDVLGRCRVRALTLDLCGFVEYAYKERNLDSEIGGSDEAEISRFFDRIESRTIYKATDAFGRCYVYLSLPETEEKTVLFIGPYLMKELSAEELLELGEKNSISPKNQQYLSEYFLSLPIIRDKSFLTPMLEAFAEKIWGSPSYAVVDINETSQILSPLGESSVGENLDDSMVNIKAMEKRYAFENELIDAVTFGQIHKEEQILSAFSRDAFEVRAKDPLRNVKNYCVIMNTLLRKAAERGGVHPVYIDKLSSKLAHKIEAMPSVGDNDELMREIFTSYCRLVRKHALKSYSLLVQKTMLLIDADISANLTLSSLAAAQNISSGYLAQVFKRETGKTLSEYVREKRVKYAMKLLSTTHLQVQTVAFHCGILDVQYFSKIFKRQTGKTPKEYRELAK